MNLAEYKRPTIERRLGRRMVLRGMDSAAAYLGLLEREPGEIHAFYEDALIHVTSFFRDAQAFESLRANVFPEMVANKAAGKPVRLWVAGCSTGEEVYSLAICLLEYLHDTGRTLPLQIFGSDVSGRAVEKARAGIYPDAVLRDIGDDRRRTYFTKIGGGYRINKSVRDLCVFVRHNLARDPPFSKLDLVSCRNVLIYFEQDLQRRVLPVLHYCLNSGGFLLLGRTESISGFGQFFVPVDRAHKIFSRTARPSRLRFAPRREVHPAVATPATPSSGGPGSPSLDLARHVDRLLLGRYAPPGVVINERMEILQFRGSTGAYLQPAPGEPQTNVLKMARDGLLAAVRTTVARAKQTMGLVRKEGVEVEQDGFVRRCNLVVVPLTGVGEAQDRTFVLLFEPVPAAAGDGVDGGAPARKRSTREGPASKLGHELAATREYLQSVIEEHGRTNDELGATNEELISGNEELQSMNEELETAKEELQSTNEELTTVNDELQSRNQEMNLVNNDLVNLLDAVDIPILILDTGRRIRRFTPRASSILNVLATDVGRPLGGIKTNVDIPDLEQRIDRVIERMQMEESEVQDREGRWYRMQIRPYRTPDHRVDGAILSLVDIDSLKLHIGEAQKARAQAEQANRAKDEFLAVLSHELRSPLSSMLFHAQRLQRGALEPAGMTEAGRVIERGTRLQIQLIEDLLDVSRIVSGKLNLRWQTVDLNDVVRAALESVSDQAGRRSIRFDVDLDPSITLVKGDSTRLEQVFWNLFNNAVKFSKEGASVAVSLQEADGQARVRVTDTGAGIDAKVLPHIWERFVQEDSSSSRTFGGLGLGLAIVRHVIEAHDGRVFAESPGKDQGTTFFVTLPLLASRSQVARPADADGIQTAVAPIEAVVPDSVDSKFLRGMKILVVDDDWTMREALVTWLGESGALVKGAGSADEAMAVFSDFLPDVLLSDVAMPGEDGYGLVRQVQALDAPRQRGVRAIALTALAGEADRQRALSAGFHAYLLKPVDLDTLAGVLCAQASSQ